jgi:hypothetical protein
MLLVVASDTGANSGSESGIVSAHHTSPSERSICAEVPLKGDLNPFLRL